MKKLLNTTNKILPSIGILSILIIWQLVCYFGIVPEFMLPSPFEVVNALFLNFGDLMSNLYITLFEALTGLFISVILAFLLAVAMDNIKTLHKTLYPVLVLTQTIPVVAIAPLLVLWLGYGVAPKITLIVIVCFFPLTVGLLDGFKSVDIDSINLLKAMGAKKYQVYQHIKFPSAMPVFLPSLKISVSYAFVGAVISEWLGGEKGLGVYMIRVRKSYAFDKMFAVILVIMLISLFLIGIVNLIEKKVLNKGRELEVK